MKAITDNDSRRWRIHAAYLSALFCAIAITWFLADTWASIRELELQNRVRSIHFLMNNYVEERSRTGEWPEVKNLYDVFFSLKSSVETGDTRVDTFFAAGPDMWLQFRLKSNGEITFDVSWDKSGFESPH